ncbi:unnamed protein product [Rotaria sordida]|uniref:Uncharacterized protein n=1 Tax=Rotaria sordida TaxID=392033 RepID=A0A814A4T9_9BILA|nr:unnamed protein product [Rotaria sordida]CAF0995022.1 unnamed protein product [Rotaria sordida]CAF1003473.1 unnamed protein product [Rotaria sordida]CAF1095205.1 unnamed protein product [Rotaria sordida]CAF3936485.1 unnamed protein product [Rotaria sordida]
MKLKIAYIVQDDEFFDKLTVREQLIFIARLKLPWHLAEKHVQLLVKKLYLQKCINSPIYLISYGEKKRLSIATKLLTNSSILVLDEPTSGLDSTLATSLIQLLRNLANDQRKTIVLSIHQSTSQIFQIFDQVMLISEGRIVFMNKPQAAVPYFTSLGYQCPAYFNPADYMIAVISTTVLALKFVKEKNKRQ